MRGDFAFSILAVSTLATVGAGPALAAEFAPVAARGAAIGVCADTVRERLDLGQAAARKGLTPADEGAAFPLPGAGPRSAADPAAPQQVWQAGARDGAVLIYATAGMCNVVVAHAPPAAMDLVVAELARAGMTPGASGPMPRNGRYQQLTSMDGRVYANVVAFEPVVEGALARASSPVRVLIQVGAVE